MAKVVMQNVSKSWKGFSAVNDMTLEVVDREFLVLLGESGCGKTTTMRMIAGLDTPTHGDIYIGEKRVNDDAPKDRDVAMVFQNYGLYPQRTVFGNIAFPLQMRGVAAREVEQRVKDAAEKVQLGHLLDRRPVALSGGQRQRVALARAIVRKPAVFLMDEPLSNLDAKLRVSMRAQLKHLHQELQTTTVYVTHDQIEAMTLASRVAIMNDGIIQQIGTPEAVYNDPDNLFVAGFIGSPSMNFIRGGTLIDDCFRIASAAVPVGSYHGADVAPGNLTLGVRPEDIRLVAAGDGVLSAEVFTVELTGEATYITLRLGEQLIVARGANDFRAPSGANVGIDVPVSRTYLFSELTGKRIRPVAGLSAIAEAQHLRRKA